jgi:hypothetical protein
MRALVIIRVENTRQGAGNTEDEMTGVGGGNGERLDSWKAVAAYLGRDAGTVRRWERTRGLPIHRVPGGKGSSVFAYTDEIDAWLKSAGHESGEETPPELVTDRRAPLMRWGGIATAAAVVVLVGWWIQRPSADAADLQLHMTEQELTASSGEGRQLWAHRLGDEWRHIRSEVGEATRVLIGRHPRIYYFTSQRIRRADNTAGGGELTSLDVDGSPRWTFRFFDTLMFGGKHFGEPWAMTAFSALDGDPPPRLAIAAHHWTWSASLIAILDDDGRRVGTFAHHGWIEQLHWLSPERLAFGGFSESQNGGMVGLLDPKQLDGQGPEPVGSPHHCANCGKAPPLRMMAMPRSEVNLLTQSRFNRAIIEKTPDRLIVRTIEVPPLDGQGAADAIYEFTHQLDLVSATYSQRYWEMHDRLQLEKKVDHDREQCPFSKGPRDYRSWSPDTGWATVQLK